MTQTQAQNLAGTLAGFGNVEFRTFQRPDGQWVIRAHGTAGNKVTSTTMTTIANSVVPGAPAVVASTDEAEFV